MVTFFFVRLFVYVKEEATMNPDFWLIIQFPSEKWRASA